MPKKKKNSIVASSAPESYIFLACYFVGIVRMIFLQRTVSFQGIAAYAYAFELYNLFYLIAGGIVAKSAAALIKSRTAKKQFNNRDHIFLYTLLRSVFFAALFTVLFLFLGDMIANELLGYKLCAFVLQCFAFSFIPACMYIAIAQYLEAIGYAYVSLLSKIVHEAVVLLATILLSTALFKYGEKVSALLLESNRKYGFGAGAAAIADVIGALIVLLFVVVFFFLLSGNLRKERMQDTTKNLEKKKTIIRTTEVAGIQYGLTGLCSSLSVLLMQVLYFRLSRGKLSDKAAGYGAFYSIVYLFLLLCIVFVEIYTRHLQKALRHYIRIDDLRRFRLRFGQSMKELMVYFVPVCVFVAIFARHILRLLFVSAAQEYTILLQAACVLILVVVPKLLFESVLSVQGAKTQLAICLYSGMAAQLALFALCFANTKFAVCGIVYSMIIGYAIECIMAFVFAGTHVHLKLDFKNVLVIPLVIGIVVLGINFGLERLLSDRLGSFATVLLGMLCTFLLYDVAIIKSGIIRGRELSELPFGKQLASFGQILGMRE